MKKYKGETKEEFKARNNAKLKIVQGQKSKSNNPKKANTIRKGELKFTNKIFLAILSIAQQKLINTSRDLWKEKRGLITRYAEEQDFSGNRSERRREAKEEIQGIKYL